MGGQHGDHAADQRVTGTVNEGATAVAENVEADQQRAVERGARGGFGVAAVEHVLHVIAEQQFVAEHLFFAVKDGLAGDIAQGLDARLRSGKLRSSV